MNWKILNWIVKFRISLAKPMSICMYIYNFLTISPSTIYGQECCFFLLNFNSEYFLIVTLLLIYRCPFIDWNFLVSSDEIVFFPNFYWIRQISVFNENRWERVKELKKGRLYQKSILIWLREYFNVICEKCDTNNLRLS